MEKITKIKASKDKKAKVKKEPKKGAFAVIETGGKQYLVSEGSKIKIEILKGDYQEGQKIKFDKVLMVGDSEKDETKVGAPYLSDSDVSGVLEKIGRNSKITVIKYKAKSRYFKKRGHRQPFFGIQIESIK